MVTKVSDPMLEGGGTVVLGRVPVGSAVEYYGSTAPAGWLFAAGQEVSRTTYAALFAAIGTTYGVGDGSTTFNLPDSRGRVVVGRDNMGGTPANRVTNAGSGITATTLGATGGSQLLQQHNHAASVTDPGHIHTIGVRVNDTPNNHPAGGDGSTTALSPTTAAFTGISVAIADAGSGSGQNMPPCIVANRIIYTGVGG